MAESFEQLLIRMGFDATAVEQGTLRMLARQEAAAAKTKAIWAEADRERELSYQKSIETMIAADVAREQEMLEIHEAYLVKRAAADKVYMEQASANAVIAGGSGGSGSGFVTAEQEAAGLVGGVAVGRGAAGAAGEIRAAAKGLHGSSTVWRETAVLFREGMRGNFTRMIGSASILIGALGSLAAAVAIPLGLILAYPGYKTYKAFTAKGESEKELGEKQTYAADLLKNRIKEMQKTGVLDKSDAEGLLQRLSNPNDENILHAFDVTNPLVAKQAIEKRKMEADARAAKDQAELDKMLDKKRKQDEIEQDIKDKQEAIAFLKQNIAALDSNSLDSHEAKARLVHDELELEKDLTTQKEMQAKHEKEIADWKKWSDSAARGYMRGRIGSAMDEAEFPTIENLAGRLWTNRLNKKYGAGGRFDLGRGDGAFGSVAREYELSQKQQMYDRTYGNMAAAENDRQRMIASRNYLVQAGVANPTMLLSKIGEDTDKLRTLFDSLVRSGVILSDSAPSGGGQ